MQRKKGDGSFKKFPNGTVEFTVSVGCDLYGKRKRKKFYGSTETECRMKYKEFIKGGEKQQSNSKEYTLSRWLDTWLKTYKEKKVEASTYRDYLYIIGRVKNHKIGGMKLSQVKSLHITEFFTSIMNYSHDVRKKTRFLLNGAFECAIDNDIDFIKTTSTDNLVIVNDNVENPPCIYSFSVVINFETHRHTFQIHDCIAVIHNESI